MDNTIEKSFELTLNILRVVRLYSSNKPDRWYRFQGYFVVTVFVVFIPFMIFLNFIYRELDRGKANFNATFLVQSIGFCVKLWPFLRNQDQLRRCVYFFEQPYFRSFRGEKRFIVDECIKSCRRNTRAFVYGIMGGVTVWCLRPFFTKAYTFPMDIWLPLNFEEFQTLYYTVYVLVCLALFVVTLTALVDNFISGLACHAAAQLRVLAYSLEHIGAKSSSGEDVYSQIAECIHHHNEIINFISLYEECFSLPIFSQLSASIILLCACALQVGVMDFLSFNSIQCLVSGLAVLGQVFFYCYYGTLIYEEHNGLTKAAYMSKWYEFDVKCRKSLVTIMELSKKPMIVVTAKLIEMSYSTLTMILRRSYSLIAVLKNY